jgi:hypothetical protein
VAEWLRLLPSKQATQVRFLSSALSAASTSGRVPGSYPGGSRFEAEAACAGVVQSGRDDELKPRIGAGSSPAACTRWGMGELADPPGSGPGDFQVRSLVPQLGRRARLRLRLRKAGGLGRHRVAAPCARTPIWQERPARDAGCCGFESRRAHAVRSGTGSPCTGSSSSSTLGEGS